MSASQTLKSRKANAIKAVSAAFVDGHARTVKAVSDALVDGHRVTAEAMASALIEYMDAADSAAEARVDETIRGVREHMDTRLDRQDATLRMVWKQVKGNGKLPIDDPLP